MSDPIDPIDPIVIAIDGPSASGKSTNSKIIAAKLGFVYVDTGAMYRTLAWHALQSGTDVEDAAAVEADRATSVRRLRVEVGPAGTLLLFPPGR